MTGKNDNEIVVVRSVIIDVMDEMDGGWFTADDILDHIVNNKSKMKDIDFSITLEKIGNNLRVLKGASVVSDKKIKGKRHWALVNRSFEVTPPVKMVVAFPKKVHDSISEVSRSRDISKTEFIIESVESNLNQ